MNGHKKTQKPTKINRRPAQTTCVKSANRVGASGLFVFRFRCSFVASPLIIAHRGASAEKPENTLGAFRRALALRVDGIELDVHVLRDGVPVVFHDTQLRRLTGVRGRLTSRTWPELAKLRVAGTEPIPRLVDVLRLTRLRAVVQIELKAGVAVAPVVQAVEAARALNWVIFASFDAGLVRGRPADWRPRSRAY